MKVSSVSKDEAKRLRQSAHTLEVSTRGKGLYEITSPISEWVAGQKMQVGLLTVFCRHTSASLLIQENADPTVRRDLAAYFDQLAPEDGPYAHDSEGPDDMPAHLKTAGSACLGRSGIIGKPRARFVPMQFSGSFTSLLGSRSIVSLSLIIERDSLVDAREAVEQLHAITYLRLR